MPSFAETVAQIVAPTTALLSTSSLVTSSLLYGKLLTAPTSLATSSLLSSIPTANDLLLNPILVDKTTSKTKRFIDLLFTLLLASIKRARLSYRLLRINLGSINSKL